MENVLRMPFPVIAHYVATFLATTEGWIYEQLRHAQGIESIVLTKRVKNEREFPWPALYSTERSLTQELGRAIRGFYPLHEQACRRHGVRLLHAHFGNRALFAHHLSRHLKIPLVASFYGRDLAGDDDYRRLFCEGARFLAEGPAARQRLIDLGCPAEKVRIHRLGVNPETIDFHLRSRRSDEPLRILMAGRFVEKKGFGHGIRAFCRAAQSARVTLTIVGDAGPSPAERRVKEELLREARCAPDRITWIPFMAPAMFLECANRHHLVLQPSVTAGNGDREGGHPVVLTLLAAAGMPAIATRHCDIPEIVVDGRTGWLCEERDEEGLATAIREACEVDLEPLSRASRELVETKYDIRHQTLGEAYEGIV